MTEKEKAYQEVCELLKKAHELAVKHEMTILAMCIDADKKDQRNLVYASVSDVAGMICSCFDEDGASKRISDLILDNL
jgi:phage terminase large subunit GpA-like protein